MFSQHYSRVLLEVYDSHPGEREMKRIRPINWSLEAKKALPTITNVTKVVMM